MDATKKEKGKMNMLKGHTQKKTTEEGWDMDLGYEARAFSRSERKWQGKKWGVSEERWKRVGGGGGCSGSG